MAVKKKKKKKIYNKRNVNNKNNRNINNSKTKINYSSKNNKKNISNKSKSNNKNYKKKNNNYVNKNDVSNLVIVANDECNEKIDNNIVIEDKIGDINLTNELILDSNDRCDNGLNDIEKDNVIIDDNSNIKKKMIKVLILFIFMMILVVMVLCIPKFRLIGDMDIVISYKDNYVEPGYNVKILDKDVSSEVEITGDVLDGVVGDYQIEYYLDKFGIRFKKYRNVKIVDEDKPMINVDSDVIKVCPNQEIKDIEYNAIDAYDGDITDKVEKIIHDNDVILNVKDSSGNSFSKILKIDRVDDISPVIKLKGDSIMFINYGSKYVEPGYNVSDNCSSNLEDKVVVNGSVGREIGTYNITYSVTDDSGNMGSVTRRVIVGRRVEDNGVVSDGSIYLTFDDGPNEGTTNKILDILKEEEVKATFFVTMNGPDYLIKRMYDEGHTVALHTASHNYSYIYSSIDNYYSDLYKICDRVKKITGYDSKIIRFPGGSSNTVSKSYKKGIMTELTNLVLNDGYRYFDWNVDAMDASSARTSSDVYYNVTSNLRGNRANVVLMHDIKSITVGALRNIIKYGKESGYSFKKIDMNTKMVRHSVSN